MLVLCALGMAPAAQALHFDVEVRTSAGPVAGSRFGVAFFGDTTPLGPVLPVDAVTGALMFPGDFSDFEGGPCTTANPGFQAFAGHLLEGEELHFRAVGALSYWNPETGAWGSAPAGVEVVLFGAVPPDVLSNYIRDPVGGAAAYRYWERGTRFSAGGIEGPLAAGIARAGRGGAIHTHLDWMITSQAGGCAAGAPAGVYMVTLELWSPAEEGARLKYLASPALQVVFGHRADEAQFLAAVLARATGGGSQPPPPAPPPPPPPPPAPPPSPVITLPVPVTPWGPPRRLPWDTR